MIELKRSPELNTHLAEDVIKQNTEINQKNKFKMDYYLPIINIPKDKVCSFIKWFREDIYSPTYTKEIPQSFKEGYIFLEEIPYVIDNKVLSEYIKYTAKQVNSTFTQVKILAEYMYDLYLKNIIIHYKFENSNIYLNYYSSADDGLLQRLVLTNEMIEQGIIVNSEWEIKDNYLLIENNIECDNINDFIFQKCARKLLLYIIYMCDVVFNLI